MKTKTFFITMAFGFICLQWSCTKEETDSNNDASSYGTIAIGTQVWMTENLRVTKFNNGDNIPLITENTLWSSTPSAAYCKYENNDSIAGIYGYLYNRAVIVDSRGVCPSGWHVPTRAEWETIIEYLGGENVAGGKMKEMGFSNWNEPNTGATNESGFKGIGSGMRISAGEFRYLKTSALYWANRIDEDSPYGYCGLSSNYERCGIGSHESNTGLSIRCIKN